MKVTAKEKLTETLDNFNDMGIMQAIDNITAISYVIKVLEQNGMKFNARKVIAYGHSHGSYLGYLSNALSPGMFSHIVDNSAWLFPAYLSSSRQMKTLVGEMEIDIEFDYLASRLRFDKEILYLPHLYQKFDNRCNIVCYHGTTDNLISHVEKKQFCDQVANTTYHEISPERVDGKVFKSTNHGLDADFLHMFKLAMKDRTFEHGTDLRLEPVTIQTKSHRYSITYESGVPLLSVT